MDISVSSNFERLLFDLYDRDGAAIAAMMDQFQTGDIHFSGPAMERVRELFNSQRVSDDETCAMIADAWEVSEYLLDPHSAIGVKAARDHLGDSEVPMITLATAHPAKFPDAISRAGVGQQPGLPHHMADLFQREERYEVIANQLESVQAFMAANIRA